MRRRYLFDAAPDDLGLGGAEINGPHRPCRRRFLVPNFLKILECE